MACLGVNTPAKQHIQPGSPLVQLQMEAFFRPRHRHAKATRARLVILRLSPKGGRGLETKQTWCRSKGFGVSNACRNSAGSGGTPVHTGTLTACLGKNLLGPPVVPTIRPSVGMPVQPGGAGPAEDESVPAWLRIEHLGDAVGYGSRVAAFQAAGRACRATPAAGGVSAPGGHTHRAMDDAHLPACRAWGRHVLVALVASHS